MAPVRYFLVLEAAGDADAAAAIMSEIMSTVEDEVRQVMEEQNV